MDSEEDCVVEVKEARSGKTLSYAKTVEKYVCKVEPHKAILEHDYFIKLIEVAEKKRREEIHKKELGFISDQEEVLSPSHAKESEWDVL
jgi:hypothetical protein